MGAEADGEAAFNHLYERHARALHAYFVGRTGDVEAALDLLQESFLRVWRHLPTVRVLPEERQRSWLFTLARNAVTDYYRRRATNTATQAHLDSQPRQWLHAPDVAARLEEMEELRLLDGLIGRLPDEQRTILLMQVLGEMTSAEIGVALGKPAGTVRYHLSMARKELAGALQRMDQDGARGNGVR